MAEILLIGDNQARIDAYALAISALGHEVDICRSAHAARDRFSGSQPDLVVVDVTSPDGGSGILCGQALAAWPRVQILALAPFRDFSRTKLEQMGLWRPTAMLVHPVGPDRLVRQVVAMTHANAPSPTAAPAAARSHR